MSPIRVACQTYTWEMLGGQWQGRVDDLLVWVSEAHYAGIEITNNMIGEYAARPQDFADALAARHLQLAAFAYSSSSGFTDIQRWEDDLAGARRAIEFLRRFPEPRLGLGGAASPRRVNARARLDQAIRFYNEVGRIGSNEGISVNVHPHSHFGSLLESAVEYQYLLDRLDPRWVSFGPDTGHIIRGGQDLLSCLKTYLPRITHLHLKDATPARVWVALGKGMCEFPAVMALLESAGYSGWVVAEEESESARNDGIAAIQKNRAYLRSIGY
ncbi:MAG: sugar phosphate isomerase/epimerase [Chloroflexi bacterium]|nr:sugar phosphate isomerase/epimerase [Chloroflexota bacterium]MCL5273945.1 sugar phosphate isomerase/epimerase [Chloroflexota bacterium]